ncbi:MAG TPA: tRNA (adenosine(37)-N6)-threonylcarbamoyltransferase complex dimerization subunit type 1 TsaB [Ruminococcaceae bacterium]|nr:tRNA (adenosine(37)-N6)-threonylcarbamoyltransferase complex dimerization subunit type 1 TsaB [Oscillospiraceae bacterium]
MKILAIDTSSVSASVAICEDSSLLGESFIHIQQTHSQTLMPAVCALMKQCGISFSEIDLFAITVGPGSFTGVRIGIAAVKGMAAAYNKPCVGISTLEALAANCPDFSGTVCAALDARRNQVYNALFSVSKGEIARLCSDRALKITDLQQELFGKSVLLVGDGAQLCYNAFKDVISCRLAAEPWRFVRAATVAICGYQAYKTGHAISADKLVPAYLRLPQAERELRAKLAQKQ